MTGAVIALVVKEPLIAIPASFFSHLVCDAIPHFGVPEGKVFGRLFNYVLVGDFICAVIIMVILGFAFPQERWIIWACMIAAASPDLMWAYYRLYDERVKNRQDVKLDRFSAFHSRIQWSQTYKGAIIEVAWFILMAGLLVALKHW